MCTFKFNYLHHKWPVWWLLAKQFKTKKNMHRVPLFFSSLPPSPSFSTRCFPHLWRLQCICWTDVTVKLPNEMMPIEKKKKDADWITYNSCQLFIYLLKLFIYLLKLFIYLKERECCFHNIKNSLNVDKSSPNCIHPPNVFFPRLT